MEKYYQFQRESNGVASLYIYGDIVDESNGDESSVSAIDFKNELSQYNDVSEIVVRVQSYGGSVFSGVAIYNMLKGHKAKITVHIDGVACSIATVIAMAGDKIVMPENSMMMVHNPMSAISYGNSNDLRKLADDLEKIRESSITAYLNKSGNKLGREKLIELLDAETWLTAYECLEYGLCDEVSKSIEVVAKFNKSNVVNNLISVPIKLEEKKEVRYNMKNLDKINNEKINEVKEEFENDLAFINRSDIKQTAKSTELRKRRTELKNEYKGFDESEIVEKVPGYDLLIQKIAHEERTLKERNNTIDSLQTTSQNEKFEPNYLSNDNEVQVLKPSQKVVSGGYSNHQNLSLGKIIKGMATGKWSNAENEKEIVSQNRDGSGGVVIPAPLSDQLINMIRAKSVLLQAGAGTVVMDSSTLTFAKQIEDIKPQWKEPGKAITTSDTDFVPVTFEAKTLVGMSELTIELLEDAINIDTIVADSIVSALALELDRVGLLGRGTKLEPKGLYNIKEIEKVTVGKELESYKDFSNAVTKILSENGEPNSVIYSPRTYGEIDSLTDTTGQPLNAPNSYNNLSNKLTTTQIPNDLGTDKNGSFAVIGDFGKLLYGVRTGVTLEVSRVAGDSFKNLTYGIRAYLRADVKTIHDPHFVILDDIK